MTCIAKNGAIVNLYPNLKALRRDSRLPFLRPRNVSNKRAANRPQSTLSHDPDSPNFIFFGALCKKPQLSILYDRRPANSSFRPHTFGPPVRLVRDDNILYRLANRAGVNQPLSVTVPKSVGRRNKSTLLKFPQGCHRPRRRVWRMAKARSLDRHESVMSFAIRARRPKLREFFDLGVQTNRFFDSHNDRKWDHVPWPVAASSEQCRYSG
jgi:hypothetical protein